MFCPKCGVENPESGKFCRKCGTGLSAVSKALSSDDDPGFGDLDDYADPAGFSGAGISRHGRRQSNNPDDLWSLGIKNVFLGVGFLIISMLLFFTGVAGGHTWWWAMLFPAFSFIAGGVGNIAKSRRLEKRIEARRGQNPASQISDAKETASLPPVGTDYVSPRSVRYNTGDLVPTSVVENTTRHLELDREGETMTLPKDKPE